MKRFGSQYSSKHVIDDWIVVDSSCDDTMAILSSARNDIQAALVLKAMYPRKPLPEDTQRVTESICDMFEVLNEECSKEQSSAYTGFEFLSDLDIIDDQ